RIRRRTRPGSECLETPRLSGYPLTAPRTSAADCALFGPRYPRAVSIRPWQDSLHIDARLSQDRDRNRFIVLHQPFELGSCVELRVDPACRPITHLAQLADNTQAISGLTLQHRHIHNASLMCL